jgi:hypothetical protein
MQACVGRARTLREHQHVETFTDARDAGIDDQPGLERIDRTLEEARALEQRPQP